MKQTPVAKPVQDLLLQALETEIGGVAIYQMAVLCAQKPDLAAEWRKYLEQTERHVEILRKLIEALGLDPESTTPGRAIVREKGCALVNAMRKALKDAPAAAEVVAAECIVDAETKDHQNWKLIGELSKSLPGEVGRALGQAYEQVEDEEDEHLYHTRGWCRELWLDHLSLPAEIPPPEEERDVKSALESARLEQERKSPKRAASSGRKLSAQSHSRRA